MSPRRGRQKRRGWLAAIGWLSRSGGNAAQGCGWLAHGHCSGMDGLVAARGGLGSDWRLKGLRAGAAATACNGLAVVAATGANGAAERETSCWGSDQRGGELLSAGRGEPPAAPPGPWPVVLPEVRPPAPLPVGLRSVGIRPAGPSQPCPPLMVQEPWAAQAAGAARDRARGRDQGTAARRYPGSPRHWPPAAGRARVFAVG